MPPHELPNRTPIADPNRISKTDSYERTNERTNGESDPVGETPVVPERTRAYRGSASITLGELLADASAPPRKPTADEVGRLTALLAQRQSRLDREPGARTIAQVMDGLLDHLEHFAGHRWPVLRTGPRAPIPWALRLSIYRRDDFSCRAKRVGPHDDQLVLDHCIPWSAGGPDDSDNLRTLCGWHNEERSNYIDFAHHTTYRPTTWWCFDCWTDETTERRVWRDGTNLNRVPLLTYEGGWVETVFCAWCDRYSESNAYFVGEQGRRLLAAVAP